MSTVSQNPFDLLSEDGGVPAPAPKKTSPSPSSSTPATQKVTSSSSSKAPARGADARRTGGAGRRGGARPSFPSTTPRAGEDRAPNDYPRGNPEGGRRPPRRSGSGPRPIVTGGRGPRREFDRHSGTGRAPSVNKKDAGWGNASDELAASAKEGAVPGVLTSNTDTTDSTAPAVVEQEEKVKTLDEFLAEKTARAAAISVLPEARKAGEGVGKEGNKWKDGKVYERVEEDFFTGKTSSSKATKGKKNQKAKVHVDIQQRFVEPEDTRRSSRGNGPRGPASRGGKGPSGAGRRAGANVNVDDSRAFPELGA
ncbi:MAG: hypothetical protein DHS80DRAFT_11913 [Piptocephalis tieghemiana]|nr:MAG: hypothetical protein DHS80DRAFT_11913 [Piptocephalis tieghemiana]